METMEMWLPSNIVAEVDAVARIYYINVTETKRWNEHKSADELRMLTGWCWTSKRGDRHSYGFKTITVAYRDAWYALVQKSETPVVSRVRLVKGKVA
jgi:hypothetical protein